MDRRGMPRHIAESLKQWGTVTLEEWDEGLQTAARVWDSLLEEGSKILYRVALALLKLHEPELLRQDNPGDLINCLRHCTQRCHDRDKLMKVSVPLPLSNVQCARRMVNNRMLPAARVFVVEKGAHFLSDLVFKP